MAAFSLMPQRGGELGDEFVLAGEVGGHVVLRLVGYFDYGLAGEEPAAFSYFFSSTKSSVWIMGSVR